MYQLFLLEGQTPGVITVAPFPRQRNTKNRTEPENITYTNATSENKIRFKPLVTGNNSWTKRGVALLENVNEVI